MSKLAISSALSLCLFPNWTRCTIAQADFPQFRGSRGWGLANGQRLYQERVPNMGMINASPLVIGDQLLLVDEAGEACVLQAGPEFKVLGSGKLEDTFWSTPAISEGAIFLRGLAALYCIRTSR